MQFDVYASVTGGSSLWSSGTVSVQVTGGIFSVLLGEGPQPPIALSFDQDYWLEVTIESDVQSPRKQLGSVGYAYIASGLVPGTTVSGAVATPPFAVIKGENLASSGIADGILGESHSTDGAGVTGWAYATSGTTYGVFGRSDSPNGRGVYGLASATTGITCGGRFESVSSSGRGIYAYSTANTGNTIGVYGRSYSTSGQGVYGLASATTGETYGGLFESVSPSGTGVYAYSTANTGNTTGVYGRTFSTDGTGVLARATATTGDAVGLWALSASDDGLAVFGNAYSTAGGNTVGVSGWSLSSSGVGTEGWATASTGTTYGISGWNESTSGTGVRGRAYATTGTNYGVYGETLSPSGYGVYYVGGLGGTGLMNSVVMTSQGPTSLDVHTTAGNWVEDFGEARLVEGQAFVELDPVFLETVTINEANPMHVFVQPYNPGCEGLVVERGGTGFHVVKPRDSQVSGMFSYRVVAKKRGFEKRRLEVCEAARTDPNLYPELREKKLLDQERELARMERRQLRLERERARIDEERAHAERERAGLTEIGRKAG
jgi:hypothetical protein